MAPAHRCLQLSKAISLERNSGLPWSWVCWVCQNREGTLRNGLGVREAARDQKFGISSEGSIWDLSRAVPSAQTVLWMGSNHSTTGNSTVCVPCPSAPWRCLAHRQPSSCKTWLLGWGWAGHRLSPGSGLGLKQPLCAGSVNGDVRFFDPRMPESMKVLQIVKGLTALDIHPQANLFAW